MLLNECLGPNLMMPFVEFRASIELAELSMEELRGKIGDLEQLPSVLRFAVPERDPRHVRRHQVGERKFNGGMVGEEDLGGIATETLTDGLFVHLVGGGRCKTAPVT